MKILFTGLESCGKSLYLSKIGLKLLERNEKWCQKYGFIRKVYSNLRFSAEIDEKYKDYIAYWSDIDEIVGLRGVDILHDEISTDYSASRGGFLSRQVARWLRQGSKTGVHYYGTAQEFANVDIEFRRRVNRVYHLKKLFGSGRGGENIPPIKFIWGVIMLREIDIQPYNEIRPRYLGLPHFFFITKKLCNIFDTYQPIYASKNILNLVHIDAHCKTCGLHKVIHR